MAFLKAFFEKRSGGADIRKSAVAFCLALSLFFGGCVAEKTVETTEPAVITENEQTNGNSGVTADDRIIVATRKMSVSATETEAETAVIPTVSKIVTTIKNSVGTTRKTTAVNTTVSVQSTTRQVPATTEKRAVTTARSVVTTDKVTSALVSTSSAASTAASVSTTARIPATTKPTTTQAPTTTTTTAPIEKPVYIEIDNRKIYFKCSESEIIGAMGEPTETIKETTDSGSAIHHLVYAQNYAELMVFQTCNDKLLGFYTFKRDAVITDGEKSYSLKNSGDQAVGKTYIKVYGDKTGSQNFAVYAQYDNFSTSIGNNESVHAHEKLVFHATNALRAINGVAPLEYCESASDCARRHTEDMASRDYFDHSTPEGLSPSDRMRNAGIDFHACGENIDAGYSNAFYMVYGWYNSAGHRRNMLSSDFTHLGVGITNAESYGSSHDYYGCQCFYA